MKKNNQKSWSSNEMKNGPLKSDNNSTNFRSNKKLIKISAKVTGRKLINNGKYTEYNIFISTDFDQWTIQKRYSEFDALNQSLIQKIPEINQYFPPKRFFKNSEETIDERVKYFNTYLHKLFNNYDIFLFDEVIDFIRIDKKILQLAISKHTMGNKDKENEPLYDSVKKSIEHLTKNERASSFDGNDDQKSESTLSKKMKSHGNIIEKRRDSNFSGNLNINLEINAKNNNDNSNKNNGFNLNVNNRKFEENNKNYFLSLLEYENSKKSSESLSNESPLNRIMEELLKNLNQKNDNKTAIIKSFEEFLKINSWPKFSEEEIIKLYIGIKNYKKLNIKNNENINTNTNNNNNNDDNNGIVRRAVTSKIIKGNFQKKNELRKNTEKQKIIKNEDSFSYSDSSSIDSDEEMTNNKSKSSKNAHSCNLMGLFSLIGNYEKNLLLSANCLDLLVKLLSVEFNPCAGFYIEVFKGRRILEYQSLNLEDIIRANIGGAKSVINAMKLLYILFKDDKRLKQYTRILLKNDVVFKKYKIFEKNYYE